MQTGMTSLNRTSIVRTQYRREKSNTRSSRLDCKAAVKESATGVEFPDTVGSMQCLGAGVRSKKIAFLNVKVYAMAMYADPSAKGMDLGTGEFDKAMCLQLVRDVDAKTFMEALNDGINPRLARIATDAATASDAQGNFMAEVAEAAEKAEEMAQDQLEQMGDFFLGKENLTNGTQILLSFPAGKGMQISTGSTNSPAYDKAAELELVSKELSDAILDVWLGDDPLVPEALESFKMGALKL